tara:strand:+ start:188 stop:463 length:276 start_codon:yes stop_codon:yes gene_type:complete
MTLKEIRRNLIKQLKQAKTLPKVVYIVDLVQRPFGGAALPVFGYEPDYNESKEDVIEFIKYASKRDLVDCESFQFDNGWRHIAYNNALKNQ